MKIIKPLNPFLYLLCFSFCFIFNAEASISSDKVTATYTKSIVSTSCWSNNHVIATPTQQNALAVYKNYVYTVYYNADRYLCISRSSNNGQGDWKTVVLSHRYEMRNDVYDNHNTPNIAISPKDERIHLSFDMHARDLRYIISVENAAVLPDSDFTADKFSATRDYITEAQTKVTSVTYPRFILGIDSTLLFSYRGDGGSGSANSYLVSYRNNGYWDTPTKIVNGKTGTYNGTATTSSTRCAYYNDFVYKSGVLYLTWTWRETPDGGTNHDMMFAYSEDNGKTWKNTNNQALSLPMHLNSTDLKVVTIPQSNDLINHNGCAVDAFDNVHAIMRDGSVYKHFYRIGTNWKSQDVNHGESVGDRPKLYCGDSTSTLYLVVRRGSEIGLFASDHNDEWSTWTKVNSINDNYMSASNSFISSDGKTLRTMVVTSDNELHLITWNLNTTAVDTSRFLAFSNISDGQEIDAGSELSIEAEVGSAFTEVSLWSGTTNLGTKNSAPYVWSGHPILTDMNEPTYSFKLIAKDASEVEVEKTLTITTDAPSPHTFTGEGQYKFYNPNKLKWMGYDVPTDDALVTDAGEADINKFNVVANGDKYNIYTSDNQKVVIINSAQGASAMLATPTAEVLASGDALFSFDETAEGSELYYLTSGVVYDSDGEFFTLNVKSNGSDIGRGTSGIDNYQWQLTRLEDTVTNIKTSYTQGFEVKLYPNPTKGIIYFEGANIEQAKVYTLSGQLMKSFDVNNNKVDVSQLSNGVYLMQVVDGVGQFHHKKVVIE